MQIILRIRTHENPGIFPHEKKGQYNVDTKGWYKVHVTDDVNFSNM